MTQTLTEAQTARAVKAYVSRITATYGTTFPNQAGFVMPMYGKRKADGIRNIEGFVHTDFDITLMDGEPLSKAYVHGTSRVDISNLDGENWTIEREAFLDALIAAQAAYNVCDDQCEHDPKCDGKVVYGA